MSEQDEDFAALFEASIQGERQPFERGQLVEGAIVAIGQDVAFVSVGGKSEAQIDLAELRDADGALTVGIGDRLQARVVSTSGGLMLSRRGVRDAATQRELEDAWQAGLAVEGRVEKVVKGGYEVRLARERAFCPLSQIDTARTADPAVHVGQTYPFRIIEYKEGGRTIVVSRRRVLEEEQQAAAEAIRESIVPGAVLAGRVASVMDYGAFVDLGGGIQGLLHVSEMTWSRVPSANAVVAVGDTITVKVLRVDESSGRIALGMKQLQDDPWTTSASALAVGDVRTGTVTRVAEFGAFVELAPGVEGLAHASTFPPTGRPGGWAASVPAGTTAPFEILTIDLAQKRIGLAPVDAASSRAAGTAARDTLAAGALVTGKVERHEPFGVFVFLAPGRTGLMPLAETGLDRGADLAKALPVGSDVDVVIQEIDPAGRRIRVSRRAVALQREQAELRDYAARQDSGATGSIGSLADKLRGALGNKTK